jgi:hypothetical protein
MPLTIVFVERKNRCNEVAQALQDEGIPAAALHGGLSQVWAAGCHLVEQCTRALFTRAQTYLHCIAHGCHARARAV